MNTPTNTDPKGKTVTVQLPDEELLKLDSIVARMKALGLPGASRSGVARAAIQRLNADELERETIKLRRQLINEEREAIKLRQEALDEEQARLDMVSDDHEPRLTAATIQRLVSLVK